MNGAIMVTGSSSFSRPLSSPSPGRAGWKEGQRGLLWLGLVTPWPQVGHASCLSSWCPFLETGLTYTPCPYWEAGMSGEFGVVRDLLPMLPCATLSTPPTCMEWDFVRQQTLGVFLMLGRGERVGCSLPNSGKQVLKAWRIGPSTVPTDKSPVLRPCAWTEADVNIWQPADRAVPYPTPALLVGQ